MQRLGKYYLAQFSRKLNRKQSTHFSSIIAQNKHTNKINVRTSEQYQKRQEKEKKTKHEK